MTGVSDRGVHRRKYQDRSSTSWLPTRYINFAGPSDLSSTVLITRTAASITAPNELSHASLSWLDRKKTSMGYARWLSSTAAAHCRQSSNVLTSSSGIPWEEAVSNICTPEGGAPANASSVSTNSSRRWKDS